jgi:plastocyanin
VGRLVELTLFLNDYGFNASRGGPTITVYVNDRVRITLTGNGSGPIVHDFVLDSGSPSPYNVRSNKLSRGEIQVIEFVASYPGEYKYYCSVRPPLGPSHRDRGQEGTIVILPRS